MKPKTRRTHRDEAKDTTKTKMRRTHRDDETSGAEYTQAREDTRRTDAVKHPKDVEMTQGW
jgi:hypothetical protein